MYIGSMSFMKNSYNTNPAQPGPWPQVCKYLWDLPTFGQYHVTYRSGTSQKQPGNHESSLDQESAELDCSLALSPQFIKLNHSFPSVN